MKVCIHVCVFGSKIVMVFLLAAQTFFNLLKLPVPVFTRLYYSHPF